MLASKPNNTVVGLLTGTLIFVQMAFAFVYYEEIDKNQSVFYPEKFLLVGVINLLSCSLLYFLALVIRKKIVIDENEIRVLRLFRKPVILKSEDITDVSWGSPVGQRSIWLRSIRVSQKTRNDFFSVSFSNSYVLEVSVKEFSNFDELRAWFLNYGKRTGLIKVRPLEERKRSRVK